MMKCCLEVAESAGDIEAVQQGHRWLEKRARDDRVFAILKQKYAKNAETPSVSKTRCDHCGHDNRPEAKFCEHCGSKIAG